MTHPLADENLPYDTPTPRRPLEAGYRNIRLEISYDGKGFFGYQRQPHVKTVQSVLEEAWKILTGEFPILYACSRLDAGVSATQFVLNLHTKTTHDEEKILRALNGILHQNLQENICVYRVTVTEDSFHARFDAVGKHYRYLVWYGYGTHADLGKRSWQVRSKNDPYALPAVLRLFEGTHDFAAFRAQDCAAKRTIRTLHRCDAWRHPRFEELFICDFWGEGFLKNMIRNIVGTAVDVATGKLSEGDIHEAFVHRERVKVGQCAPAHPLKLERIFYSQDEYHEAAKKLARHFVPC